MNYSYRPFPGSGAVPQRMPARKDRNTALYWLNIATAYSIGLCIIWCLYRLFLFPGSAEINAWVQYFHLVLLAVILCKVKIRGNLWYWMFSLVFVILYATSALRSPKVLQATTSRFWRAVLVYMLCPAVGLLISGESLKRFLKCFIGVWTAFYAALCIWGITCVIQGVVVTAYHPELILGLSGQNTLELFDRHHSYTSTNMALSIMMALIGIAISEKKVSRILYALSILPMFLCLAMTSGRCGTFSTGIGFGLAAAIMLQKPFAVKIPKKALRAAVSFALIVVIAAGTLLAIDGTQILFNRVMSGGNIGLIPDAEAEEAEQTTEAESAAGVTESDSKTVRERTFLQEDFLTGRLRMWEDAFKTIQAKPEILWKGASVVKYMTDVRNLSGDKEWLLAYGINHLHNVPIFYLVSTGIWGLLLYLFYLVLLIIACWRLFFDWDRPLWERFIMLPAVIITLVGYVDCMTKLSSPVQVNLILMLFYGLTIVMSRKTKTPKQVLPGSRAYGAA